LTRSVTAIIGPPFGSALWSLINLDLEPLGEHGPYQ